MVSCAQWTVYNARQLCSWAFCSDSYNLFAFVSGSQCYKFWRTVIALIFCKSTQFSSVFLIGTSLVGCNSFFILVLKITMSEFRHIVIILVLSTFFYSSTELSKEANNWQWWSFLILVDRFLDKSMWTSNEQTVSYELRLNHLQCMELPVILPFLPSMSTKTFQISQNVYLFLQKIC